ncbi:electron transport complex subunit E [Tissierella sp. Yu-01]|uniref:electron transport complex subunit RsxE n=1 Tax=Tissierella sp. Yu-01 TaxID=3035694 RepID=UPI00240E47A2|nr:electron transport complex subunit E [Tissierella sp. Yu-01]WFA09481.1 electron transport complex subunit E [Tissierella sp. Yu-01]
MKFSNIIKNGIISENPILVSLIGMCSVLAVSSSAINSIAMGASVIAVLTCSNIAISLLRKFIPNEIRIPVFIVVIATFVTIVDMFLKAYAPDIYAALGIFIPLIVVNCLILARAEAFAYTNGVIASAVDGFAMGLGYTLAITILGVLREILGAGSVFGISLFGESFQPAAIFVAAPGAFILLGILIAIFRTAQKKVAAN